MSTADFQQRLRRINADVPQQQPMDQGSSQAMRTGARKLNVVQLVAGGAILLLGNRALKQVNENYEAIRDSSGIGTAAGLSLVSIAVFLAGIFILARGFFNLKAGPASENNAHFSTEEMPRVPKASNKAKLICSLVGLVLGVFACLCLALAAFAGYETEKALQIAICGIALSILLLLFAITTGIVGIFKRGFALGRVPGYFVIGAVLTFSTIRYFRINPSDWQQFAEILR
ncbi:hypothetical protein [Parasedimentitalea maritima]|uniref:Uncharacterized protein n=1 Tax=Parasedimentitalea maritima TaxID=2578117 RepID=A0A6A4RJ35_9RHOB|nr:hypothetical protein [Zongyanglinia marina]KAE9629546.1 hypothetical protein GP644_11025 [Zongyanglinia marina]